MASGAKVAAAAGDNHAANFGAAAIARFAFAGVGAMLLLIPARLAFGIEKIGDGRTVHGDGFSEDLLESAVERGGLLRAERRREPRGMNFCAPETFIGVDITDAAKKRLIEEKSFDAGAAGAKLHQEIGCGDFERIGAEARQLFFEKRLIQIGETAKAARVGVAQLAGIIEAHEDVGVLGVRLRGGKGTDLTGHAEMNEKRGGSGVAVGGRRSGRIRMNGREAKKHEFAVAVHCFNAAAGQVLFESGGIVDEVGFAKADGQDTTAEDRAAKAAGDSFDFGEFGHKTA